MKILLVLAMAFAVAVPFSAAAEKDPARCGQLRRQLEIVDAQLNKRPSPQLSERRRVLVAEMTDLECSGDVTR